MKSLRGEPLPRPQVGLALLLVFAVALGLAASVITRDPFRRMKHGEEQQGDAAPAARQNPLRDLDAPDPDNPGEALRWRRLAWLDEKGEVPPQALLNASRQREENLAYQMSQNQLENAGMNRGSWVSRGPQNVGGRTRSLVIHPTDRNTLWAAAVSGGVWKSTNAGASWFPLDDFMASLNARCLAINPTNPNVLYCGTGEVFYGDARDGAGIFKTTDGGATWNQLPATANWQAVNRIAISPVNSNVILASTVGQGIQRSTDGGLTWSSVTSAYGSLVVAFHPTDGNKAIAHIIGDDYHFNNTYNSVLYSTDGGLSWQESNLNHFSPVAATLELAYAPSSPNIVYANFYDWPSSLGKVWRSTDGGMTYSPRTTSGDTQASVVNALWVSPTDPNFLLIGGVHVFKSVDGGASLTQITSGYTLTVDPHPDQHFIIADPGFNGTTNKRVYVCNDGGVFRTDDVFSAGPGNGWVNLNNTYQTTQYYADAGHGGTRLIIGGTQDNGTLRSPSASQNASLMFGGDGGFSAVDPNDDTYCYGEYTTLQIHRSQDHGVSSSYIYGGLTDAEMLQANFIAPFILDPNNSNRMLAGGISLWRSNNVRLGAPPTWSRIRPPGSDLTSAIAVAKGNSDIIWVAQNNGEVYKTVNGLSGTPTWTTVDDNGATNPLPNRYAARILIDPDDANTVYVSFGGFSDGNLQRTTDGGTTWADVTGSGVMGLPLAPIRGIARHPNHAKWLYVGTEVGVFASQDGGATWSAANQGPANVSVDELVFLSNSTTLLAATHGRGLWTTETTRGSAPFDLDNDGRTDLGYYRNGTWSALQSTQGYGYCCAQFFSWGGAGLPAVTGDFDGDGRADIGYIVPPSGGQSATYAILLSSRNYSFAAGQPLFVPAGFPSVGDTPVVGDFDGDGRADPGIWRGAQGVWIIPRSSSGYTTFIFNQWGQNGDVPLPNNPAQN